MNKPTRKAWLGLGFRVWTRPAKEREPYDMAHRLVGPALEWDNGRKEWCLDGKSNGDHPVEVVEWRS